jgi:hypothetical protein
MKSKRMWKAVAVAVAVGLFVAANLTMAEGGKVRQDNGNARGSTPRTGTR